LQSDSSSRPRASRSTLTENGAVFGTPHSLAARIKSEGGGLYVHWGPNIFFSTPDNSDPRTNGRTYGAILRFKTPTWLWLVALAAGSAALGILFPRLPGLRSAFRIARMLACSVGVISFLIGAATAWMSAVAAYEYWGIPDLPLHLQLDLVSGYTPTFLFVPNSPAWFLLAYW